MVLTGPECISRDEVKKFILYINKCNVICLQMEDGMCLMFYNIIHIMCSISVVVTI